MARGKRQRFIVPNVGITVESKEIAFTLVHRAIRLYFYDEDILSAHVVAGAAREFIQGQLKSIDKKTLDCIIKENVAANSERIEVIKSVRQRVYDSLKHFQGKDNPDIKGFTIRETEGVLLEMSLEFTKLYGPSVEMALFFNWISLLHKAEELSEFTEPKLFEDCDLIDIKDYKGALLLFRKRLNEIYDAMKAFDAKGNQLPTTLSSIVGIGDLIGRGAGFVPSEKHGIWF